MSSNRMPRLRRITALLLAIGVALGLGLASAAPSAAQVNDNNGQIRWEGWSFRYQISDLFDGISISNVRFNDTEVLSRASLPVMNVYYELPLGQGGCGPFADRLGGNEPTTVREFVQNGEKWLEIGMEDDIGAYGIYQVFYLSENGVIDAHIFSKGLQCRYFHEHIPFWRLDFDVAGSAGDQILRRQGSSYVAETTEFNRPATDAAGHDWRIRDRSTGREVAVYFDNGSFSIPGDDVVPETQYVENRVFGVRYESDEIKWSGGPRRDLRIVDGGSIENTDVVMWYSGYMPHSPDEGAELWHSTGVRIVLDPDNPGPGPVPTASPDPTVAPSATPTRVPSPTPTATPTATPTPTPQPTATSTPAPTATSTPQPAPTIRVAAGTSYTFSFESGEPAWQANPRGTDRATSGFWEQAMPERTEFNGNVLQPGQGAGSSRALVTQADGGRSVGTYDIDGGVTSILSPPIAVAGGSGTLSLDWYFSHLSNSNRDDYFQVTLLGDNGGTLPVVAVRADGTDRPHEWSSRTVNLANLGSSFQILVAAADGERGSIVEAGVDNIRIDAGAGPIPTPSPVPTPTTTPVSVATPTPNAGPGAVIYSQPFESGSDWIDITDDMPQAASNGRWEHGRPQRTSWNNLTMQPAGGADGSYRALATGPLAGSGVGTYDIDGGTTAALSPEVQLPASGTVTLTYDRFLAHATNANADDLLSISVRTANGSEVELERVSGTAAQAVGVWSEATLDLSQWRGTTIRLVVRAADGGAGGVIEAGVDNITVRSR